MKDIRATAEAVSPQKKNIHHFKHEITSVFSIFMGHFGPLESGSSRPKSIWVHADPDPQRSKKNFLIFPGAFRCGAGRGSDHGVSACPPRRNRGQTAVKGE
jgi:hypothetical protein